MLAVDCIINLYAINVCIELKTSFVRAIVILCGHMTGFQCPVQGASGQLLISDTLQRLISEQTNPSPISFALEGFQRGNEISVFIICSIVL